MERELIEELEQNNSLHVWGRIVACRKVGWRRSLQAQAVSRGCPYRPMISDWFMPPNATSGHFMFLATHKLLFKRLKDLADF